MQIFSRKPLSEQDIPQLWQAYPLSMNQKKLQYHVTSDSNVATPPNALDHDNTDSEGFSAQVQNFSTMSVVFLIAMLASSINWQFILFISI